MDADNRRNRRLMHGRVRRLAASIRVDPCYPRERSGFSAEPRKSLRGRAQTVASPIPCWVPIV